MKSFFYLIFIIKIKLEKFHSDMFSYYYSLPLVVNESFSSKKRKKGGGEEGMRGKTRRGKGGGGGKLKRDKNLIKVNYFFLFF